MKFVFHFLLFFLSGNYCKIIIEEDGVDIIDLLIKIKSHTSPQNEAYYKIMELVSTVKIATNKIATSG